MKTNIVIPNDFGLYCPAGDFYIDPWKPVDRAIITHAHSDHARYGMKSYLAHHLTVPILRHRLGSGISISGIGYGEKITMGDAIVSLHPAGHLIGSAQIRIEVGGEVWVISGDYKRQRDPYADEFEVVPCDTFVTECTFGMPIYRWKTHEVLRTDINDWWRKNNEAGKASVLFCYALGKAQRLLGMLDTSIAPVYTHGAVENINELFRENGIALPATQALSSVTDKRSIAGSMILAPGSAENTPWLKRAGIYATGVASGWMAVRGNRRRRAADRGFAVSDHVDWPDLLQTIRDTGAERILATHGFTAIFVRWLRENGYDASELHTLYGTEEDDTQMEGES